MNKYRNKKVKYDGILFDSIAEKNRYIELKILEKTGNISNLKLQPKFVLQESFKIESEEKNSGYEIIRAITYIADFQYREKGDILDTIEDVKGKLTEVYKIKKKIFLKLYGDKYHFLEYKI